jgi:AAA+ ATPase superfamily predicted ATPase
MINYAEPVIGKDFFARDDIVSELLKSAEGIKQGYRQNIAIIGSSLIGKSSLLLRFLGDLNRDKQIFPIYIDMQNLGVKEFAEKIINIALYNLLKKDSGMEPPLDTESLIKAAKDLFPKTCDLAEKVAMLIEQGNFEDAFSEALDMPALLSDESGHIVVMVFDEFDCISAFKLSRPYQVLGSKVMVQKKTLFVFSSSSAVTAKRILSEKLSLLFGGFKVLDISPFNSEQSRDFIYARSKGIIIPRVLVDFIISFTGGHPFYLSAIMEKINFACQYGADKITVKRLSGLISELLFRPAGVLNQFFCDTVNDTSSLAGASSILDILKSFTRTGRISDICKRNTISNTGLNAISEKLMEMGFLQKSGSLYALTDSMFKMWVEIKSKPRNLYFDFMPIRGWDDYTNEIEARIIAFRFEQSKSFGNKVIELISSFNDDKFFIDERVRVLPKVESINLKKYHKYDILKASASKKGCVFVLCHKRVSEEDVADIYDKLRILKIIKNKIAILAFSGIEPAAKLMAKQKSFCLWDKNDIVKLFSFYKGYNVLIA